MRATDFSRDRAAFIMSTYFMSSMFEEMQNTYLDYVDRHSIDCNLDSIYSAVFAHVMERQGMKVNVDRMLKATGKHGYSSFYKVLGRLKRLKEKDKKRENPESGGACNGFI